MFRNETSTRYFFIEAFAMMELRGVDGNETFPILRRIYE